MLGCKLGSPFLILNLGLWLMSTQGCTSTSGDDSDVQTWESNLAVTTVDGVTLGGVSYASCSQLAVSWSSLPTGHDQVRLTVTDASSGLSFTLQSKDESLTLDDLKSATSYTVAIEACQTASCEAVENGGSATGETAEEVWQLLGSGHTIDDLTNIVSDSNAKAHAFVYGDDAPTDLRGKMQLYYGALGGYGGSLSVATSNHAADPDDESSYSDFTSYVGSSGIIEPDSSATLVKWIGTGQGVPLTEALGGGVRLFFEARGSDSKTRIMSLDSQDGYEGTDFNTGSSGYCELASDYEEGGGCHPAIVIGVEGDTTAPAAQIANARQQKVGVQTLSDWRWGEEAGTFMVFTTDSVDGCGSSQKNHGYAVYDGSAWEVQYEDTGCPKLFKGVQAMAPLDLGEGRFKIQFGNPDETDGAIESNLPFLGPKRIIYGDTARTGDPETMEFEDWDSIDDARDMIFLWPDGEVFDTTAEGYIDDFVVLTPTFDVEHQVQLVVLTDGERVPFTSVAILRNR